MLKLWLLLLQVSKTAAASVENVSFAWSIRFGQHCRGKGLNRAEDFRLPVEENGYYTWPRHLQNHCKGADNLGRKKKKQRMGNSQIREKKHSTIVVPVAMMVAQLVLPVSGPNGAQGKTI